MTAVKRAIRDVYGETLAQLGRENPDVVALDADVGSSSKSIIFGKEFPARYFNVGVAEANMVARAAGLATAGKIPFANTFAAFMVLRDPAVDMSLNAMCSSQLVAAAPVELTEGTQVVVCGKPSFYPKRGTLSLRVTEIRAVGIGELLARIDRLRHAAGVRYFDFTPVMIVALASVVGARYLAIGTGDTELYVFAGMLAAVVISIRVFIFRGAGKAN